MTIQFDKLVLKGKKGRFKLLMDITVFKSSANNVFSIGNYYNSIFILGSPKYAWVCSHSHADLRL